MDGVKQCKHGRNFCCECHMAGGLNPAREALKPENQRIYPVGTTRDYESELAAWREELANEKSENQHLRNHIDQLVDDKLDIQQRLTAAEQRNAELSGLLQEVLDSKYFHVGWDREERIRTALNSKEEKFTNNAKGDAFEQLAIFRAEIQRACEDPRHRIMHTQRQMCTFLDGMRLKAMQANIDNLSGKPTESGASDRAVRDLANDIIDGALSGASE